ARQSNRRASTGPRNGYVSKDTLRCAAATPWRARHASALRFDRGQHVGHDVLRLLDTDREPHEPRIDPDRRELLVSELVIAHHGRLLDEALHTSEARRDRG